MRKWLKDVERALRREGVKLVRWEVTGTGHQRVHGCCAQCGACVNVVTSTTPSDRRTLLNLVGVVRRQLREKCATISSRGGNVQLAATIFACVWHSFAG